MNLRARSSRATGPKMRVPMGSSGSIRASGPFVKRLERGIYAVAPFSTTRQRFNFEIGAVSSMVTLSPTLKTPLSS